MNINEFNHTSLSLSNVVTKDRITQATLKSDKTIGNSDFYILFR